MCLSCGHPFPPGTFDTSSGGGSSLVVPILIGAFLALSLVGGTTLLLLARSADKKAEAAPASDASVPLAPLLVVEDSGVDASVDAATPPPLTDEEKDRLEGNYRCSMDDTPAFPCRIANGRLEKLGGSQRFRGPIRKLGSGNLEFSGEFFCPFGACDHPVACTFVRQGPGRYVGKFGPNSIPGGGPGGERVVLTKVR